MWQSLLHKLLVFLITFSMFKKWVVKENCTDWLWSKCSWSHSNDLTFMRISVDVVSWILHKTQLWHFIFRKIAEWNLLTYDRHILLLGICFIDDACCGCKMNRLVRGLYVRDNCHPLKEYILPWIQIPLWISMSLALRNMSGSMIVDGRRTYFTYNCFAVRTRMIVSKQSTSSVTGASLANNADAKTVGV